jgi:hypothetical protein
MKKREIFKKWILDSLYKRTYISTLSSTIDFYTPKGITARNGDVYFYDDTVHVKYGIPDDMELSSEIEREYVDTLLDMEMDYDMWPERFKDGESVYDNIQKFKTPLRESDDLKQNNFLRKIEIGVNKKITYDWLKLITIKKGKSSMDDTTPLYNYEIHVDGGEDIDWDEQMELGEKISKYHSALFPREGGKASAYYTTYSVLPDGGTTGFTYRKEREVLYLEEKLNESSDKREKLIDFVSQRLYSVTKIIHEEDEGCEWVIDTPWMTDCFDDIYPCRNFYDHVEEFYGLTPAYGKDTMIIVKVWSKYFTLISSKIRNRKLGLTESDQRKQKYFDYIIKDLINDTIIEPGYDGFAIELPFDTMRHSFVPYITMENLSNNISWKEFSTSYGIGGMASEYLEDKYGFNRSDYYKLLDPFWGELKEKIRKS